MKPYTPTDWYWLDADGARVYASARQAIVAEDDAGYLAFTADGTRATAWPRDATGAVSDDELCNVLDRYGLVLASPAGLVRYAASRRWAIEVGGIIVAGIPISTDDRSKTLLMGARLRAEKDDTVTEDLAAGDGSTHTVNAQQIIAISDAIGAHVSACFKAYSGAKAAITATPPTITARAQVDAAFAAISA